MFTGLIEDVGRLVSRKPEGAAAKLIVETALPLTEVHVGDSVAINGACLTVETPNIGAGTLEFHTLTETLDRTNLGDLRRGAMVNLERALRLGDRMGGHLVQGHVDAVTPIVSVEQPNRDYVVTVALPDELKPFVIPKGSVAVNGISLTIARLLDDAFTIHIIPHTWQATNLSQAAAGDPVNIETDMVGKYILRQQQAASATKGVTMTDLHSAGFC